MSRRGQRRKARKKSRGRLKSEIRSLDNEIRSLDDQIAVGEHQLAKLKSASTELQEHGGDPMTALADPAGTRMVEQIATRYGPATLMQEDGKQSVFIPEGLDADDLKALTRELGPDASPESIAEAVYRRANKIVSASAVDAYLVITDFFMKISRGSGKQIRQNLFSLGGSREATDQETREHGSHMWSRFRQARVFDIPSSTYGSIYHSADVMLTETLGDGGKWAPSDTPVPAEFDPDDFMLKCSNAAVAHPWPERMPFDWQFLSLGTGVSSDILNGIFMDKVVSKDLGFRRFLNMGFLLGPNACYAIIGASRDNRTVSTFITDTLASDRKWRAHSHYMMGPWVVCTLIDLINSYRTHIEESPRGLRFKQEWKRRAKELKLKPQTVPPPFYPVYLKQKIIQRHSGKVMVKPHRPLGHRHDRRAHERCYFRRGKLPLSAKKAAALHARGYRVFQHGPTDANTHRQMGERGLRAKSTDEWLAVKTRWIAQQIIGDESLPYVPSVHKMGKH